MMLSIEKRLAAEFARQLCEELGFAKINMVAAMNATPAYHFACASHDFCDANMTMAAAWEKTIWRPFDHASTLDAGIWNRAWDIAREFGFDTARIEESE